MIPKARSQFQPVRGDLALYRVPNQFCAIMRLMTKRILSLAFFLLLAAVNIGLIVTNLRPAGAMFGPNNGLEQGFDHTMRRNEVLCLRKGVDPYDVWSEKVDMPPYYPYVKGTRDKQIYTEPLNAYTPWEYTFILPLSFLPKQTMWWIYNVFMYMALGIISLTAFRTMRKEGPDVFDALLVTALPLLLFIPINNDMNVGNYTLLITAALLAMAEFLGRKMDIAAAIMLAFAMIKPQLALPFAIPLLIKGKLKTLLVAATICMLTSIPPAILCHKSPITLILQAPQASAHAFNGCALMPKELFFFLKDTLYICEPFLWGIPMLSGVIFCAVFTWRMRQSRNWILLFAPAALTAVSWTYVQGYSYILYAIVIIAMAVDMIRRPLRSNIILCSAAILLMARSGRAFEIVVNAALPSLNGFAAIVCSWSSTAAFILVFIWLMSLPRSANAHA